ncbi:MAG: Holliday junction branch migration protein RuvA [Desulfotomaculaceae bacterium]|nr:Holliday junction branch migration protein RuvA [Desulfotomaculaceae bacterium]
MIAFLSGRLAEQEDGAVIIEVGGIGYRVQVPLSLMHSLPEPGGQIMLHTHLAVREDDISLYGFRERGELEYFLKLLNVSGVGPKGALAALTLFAPGELGQAIVNEDLSALTRVPGIGKKTAGRIILELKDKISLTSLKDVPGRKQAGLITDAVAALEALGYSATEAHKGVKEALAGFNEEPPVAELVKKALRQLVKS